jgi:hypothetical protein
MVSGVLKTTKRASNVSQRLLPTSVIYDFQLVAGNCCYNYEYEIDDEPAEPCHCGAKNCCGYILGPHYWARLKERAPR